jgi:hypothetical protein
MKKVYERKQNTGTSILSYQCKIKKKDKKRFQRKECKMRYKRLFFPFTFLKKIG